MLCCCCVKLVRAPLFIGRQQKRGGVALCDTAGLPLVSGGTFSEPLLQSFPDAGAVKVA